MDEKTAWAALHRPLKFGDPDQIAAHEFLVDLKIASDAIPNMFGTDHECDVFLALAEEFKRWTWPTHPPIRSACYARSNSTRASTSRTCTGRE